MNPDRASRLFKLLLECPPHELEHFSRRYGLSGAVAEDLQTAKELLQALMVALESTPGPNWERLAAAHHHMVQTHGRVDVQAVGVQAPTWVRELPPEPSLANLTAEDPKPRQKFIPRAEPMRVSSPDVIVPHEAYQVEVEPEPLSVEAVVVEAEMLDPVPAVSPRRAPPTLRLTPALIDMDVGRYAALCAALGNSPHQIDAILSDYGIPSRRLKELLDDLWQDRFEDDEQLLGRWENLCHQFRSRLQR